MRDTKMQHRKMRHKTAKVETARYENAAQSSELENTGHVKSIVEALWLT